MNQAGFPYRLFSNIKPGGYYVYGRVFVVKYVLPKLTTVEPVARATPDFTSRYLGKRDVWDNEISMSMRGLKYSRSLNEEKSKSKEKIKESSKHKDKNSKTHVNNDTKKKHYTKNDEHTDRAAKKSITGTNPELALKSAKEVLNAIGPVSASMFPRQQNDVIETFPRDGIAQNRPTHIIFSAEDPLKKYEMLINGKRNITIIIDPECKIAHNLQLVVTKRDFTSKYLI